MGPSAPADMFGIGTPELLVILVIALIVVGPQRMPEVARTIGKALREFRKVQDDVKGMVKFDLDEPGPARPNGPRPGMAGAGGRPEPRVGPSARQAGAEETASIEPASADASSEATRDLDEVPPPENPGRGTADP